MYKEFHQKAAKRCAVIIAINPNKPVEFKKFWVKTWANHLRQVLS